MSFLNFYRPGAVSVTDAGFFQFISVNTVVRWLRPSPYLPNSACYCCQSNFCGYAHTHCSVVFFPAQFLVLWLHLVCCVLIYHFTQTEMNVKDCEQIRKIWWFRIWTGRLRFNFRWRGYKKLPEKDRWPQSEVKRIVVKITLAWLSMYDS